MDPFKFPDKCFVFRMELVDEYTEIVPMKGPKGHGTISVNSSTNSNLKPKHLSGNLKGS